MSFRLFRRIRSMPGQDPENPPDTTSQGVKQAEEERDKPKLLAPLMMRLRREPMLRELPKRHISPDKKYELITSVQLQTFFAVYENYESPGNPKFKEEFAAAKEAIEKDHQALGERVMDLYRSNDFEAKREQNRYRQILWRLIWLAFFATLFGALQGFAVDMNIPGVDEKAPLAFFAFGEAVITSMALMVLQTARSSPLERWIMARRTTEALRREYFRF
jgi:hypothetical protein